MIGKPFAWNEWNNKLGVISLVIGACAGLITAGGLLERIRALEKIGPEIENLSSRMKALEEASGSRVPTKVATGSKVDRAIEPQVEGDEHFAKRLEEAEKRNERLAAEVEALKKSAVSSVSLAEQPVAQEIFAASQSLETASSDSAASFECHSLKDRAIGINFALPAGYVCINNDTEAVAIRYNFTTDGRLFMADVNTGEKCFINETCSFLLQDGRDFVLRSVNLDVSGNWGCIETRERHSV